MWKLKLVALSLVVLIGSADVAFSLEVVSVSPAQHSQAPRSIEAITATFDTDLNPASIDETAIVAYGAKHGYFPASISLDTDGRTVRFETKEDFSSGDHLQVILTENLQSLAGEPLIGGYTWSFDIAPDTGTARFKLPETFAFPCVPLLVESADMDEDGDVDLVLGCAAGDLIVMSNEGDGTFTAVFQASQSTVGLYPAIADFNRDGNLDIAAHGAGDYLLLYGGDGSGSFYTLDSVFVGQALYDPRVVDFDNDGDLDIVVSDTSSTIMFLQNQSSRSLWQFAAITLINDVPLHSFDIGDFDNDGDIDLAVPYGTNNFAIYLNGGGGDLYLDAFYTTSARVEETAVADFNNDTYLDLVLTKWPSDGAFTYLNSGIGTFSYGSTIFGSYAYVPDVGIADLDANGLLDLLFPNSSTGEVLTILQTAVNFFGTDSSFYFGFPAAQTEVGDFNGDAALDALFYGSTDNQTNMAGFLFGLSEPAIQRVAPDWGLPGNSLEVAITLFDVNFVEDALSEFEAGLVHGSDTIRATAITIVEVDEVAVEIELPENAEPGAWDIWLTYFGRFSVYKKRGFAVVDRSISSIAIPCLEIDSRTMPGQIAIPITIDCDSTVAGFTFAYVCNDDRFKWSSMSFEGSIFNSAFSIGYQIDSLANTILAGWLDLTGTNPVYAPEGLMTTLYLETEEKIPAGTLVDIDTTSVGSSGGNVLSLLFNEGAISWYPLFEDCATANLNFVYPDCGDADGSGFISITDAVYLIRFIFQDGPAPSPLETGDADCDGLVNIGDAVYLIQYIFADGPAPCAHCQ